MRPAPTAAASASQLWPPPSDQPISTASPCGRAVRLGMACASLAATSYPATVATTTCAPVASRSSAAASTAGTTPAQKCEKLRKVSSASRKLARLPWTKAAAAGPAVPGWPHSVTGPASPKAVTVAASRRPSSSVSAPSVQPTVSSTSSPAVVRTRAGSAPRSRAAAWVANNPVTECPAGAVTSATPVGSSRANPQGLTRARSGR